ncbi:hypothetical protein ACIQCR_24595 [Streptomyces sp. NPDC093249]|uniref:hypothetical protein n=1 Tax=unclassified Streptomyces TaxID=2593676 RepID=UPI00380F6778
MMSTPEQREPLPQEPLICRRNAERSLGEWAVRDAKAGPLHATAWALLAVAGELAEIQRELRRKR